MMVTMSKAQEKTALSQLQARLEQLEARNQHLARDNQNLRANLDVAQAQNHSLNQKLTWLEEQIKLTRARQFGKQSETSHTLNLVLFDDNEADAVEEKIEPLDQETEQVTYTRSKRQGSRRNIDTSQLPREQVIHDLDEANKICDCGHALHQVGADTCEKIDYVPAQLKVIEHITPKYACRACETVKTASKPEQPLQKVMATPNFVVDVILKKYDEHLPLYRQSQTWRRDGVDIPDNTGHGRSGCFIPLDGGTMVTSSQLALPTSG